MIRKWSQGYRALRSREESVSLYSFERSLHEAVLSASHMMVRVCVFKDLDVLQLIFRLTHCTSTFVKGETSTKTPCNGSVVKPFQWCHDAAVSSPIDLLIYLCLSLCHFHVLSTFQKELHQFPCYILSLGWTRIYASGTIIAVMEKTNSWNIEDMLLINGLKSKHL